MYAALIAIAIELGKWGLAKLFAVVGKDLHEWLEKREQKKIAENNLKILNEAMASKDKNAIKDASEGALNNFDQ